MKNRLLKIVLTTSFVLGSGLVIAGSNNGYTTAANVYTGSSSRTWFGAGVSHVLAEWKKENARQTEAIPVETTAEEQSVNNEETDTDAESVSD